MHYLQDKRIRINLSMYLFTLSQNVMHHSYRKNVNIKISKKPTPYGS